jgi:hypothetical protein
MKKIKISLAVVSIILFFGFTRNQKVNSVKNDCGSYLYASNNTTGTTKITRVTYYNCTNQNTSVVLNLSAGQSTYINCSVLGSTEISVKPSNGGVFNYLVINDDDGTELERHNYDGSSVYWFGTLNFACHNYTINMW